MAFSILSLCPSLQKIVIFDRSIGERPRDIASVYFDEFIQTGEGLTHYDTVEERTKRASEDDLANILYTSGTTGEPKESDDSSFLLHGGISPMMNA